MLKIGVQQLSQLGVRVAAGLAAEQEHGFHGGVAQAFQQHALAHHARGARDDDS